MSEPDYCRLVSCPSPLGADAGAARCPQTRGIASSTRSRQRAGLPWSWSSLNQICTRFLGQSQPPRAPHHQFSSRRILPRQPCVGKAQGGMGVVGYNACLPCNISISASIATIEFCPSTLSDSDVSILLWQDIQPEAGSNVRCTCFF